MAVVYLIHLDEPYKHARHYLGSTLDLSARLSRHRSNCGAKLLRAVNAAGITWNVVRTWEGGRTLERALKRQKNAPRLCPACLQEQWKRRLLQTPEGCERTAETLLFSMEGL